MFIRFSKFQRKLEVDCNRFKQTVKQYNKISFARNQKHHANITMFFNSEEARETNLGFL